MRSIPSRRNLSGDLCREAAFCQISWSQEAMRYADRAELVTPEQIAETAQYYRRKGNVGVAFTYNEPLVGYEFVRDTARLVHGKGMVNVLVSNGTAEASVLEEILPFMDAMNIDMKGFTDRYYRDVLGGDREMVMRFITRAVQSCHVDHADHSRGERLGGGDAQHVRMDLFP